MADHARDSSALFQRAAELAEQARANGHTLGEWFFDDSETYSAIIRSACTTCRAQVSVVGERNGTARAAQTFKTADATKWECPNSAASGLAGKAGVTVA
jgi:hypothetical protein